MFTGAWVGAMPNLKKIRFGKNTKYFDWGNLEYAVPIKRLDFPKKTREFRVLFRDVRPGGSEESLCTRGEPERKGMVGQDANGNNLGRYYLLRQKQKSEATASGYVRISGENHYQKENEKV